jgi:hypothetical protein
MQQFGGGDRRNRKLLVIVIPNVGEVELPAF